MPAQALAQRRSRVDGERRLVLAVMERALLDFDWDWFDDKGCEPWQFVWCCEMVGLEPDQVLRRLDRK